MRVRLEADRGELQEKSKELLRAVAARIAYVDDSALDLIDKAKGERPDPLDQIPVIKEILDRVHVAYSTHVHSMVSEIEQMLIREGLFKKANGDDDDEFMGFTPQVFDGEHMHQIREAVQAHHDALIASFAGPQALSAARRHELGTSEQEENSPIALAFLFGLLLAHADDADRVKNMSYSAFEDAVRQGSIRLPDKDRQEIRALEMEAGQRLQHLGSEVALAASLVAADAMRGIDSRKAAERLRTAAGKWSDRWDRLARSVLHTARDRGAVARYKIGDLAALGALDEEEKGTYVYRQTQADACPYCNDFYNGPDGQPRIFKLSILEGNGTNAGRSKATWQPVVGATHPHCRCTTHLVPHGHGFNDDGDLVAGGPHGIRHETEKSYLRSYAKEILLQKSFRIQDTVDFDGISVAIEQLPGQVRSWMDDYGRQGQTRMRYAYGYIQGTMGSDGEELDCFVGPDPYPSHVYIIKRLDPETGYYDEDKIMLGFSNVHHAKQAFLEHYEDPGNFGSVSMVPLQEFVGSVNGTTNAVPISTIIPEVAKAAPIPTPIPALKVKSSLRLTMSKTAVGPGSYSSQSIAADSMAEDRNPSGGSGLDVKMETELPIHPPAYPDLATEAGIFSGAILTEKEIERLRAAGSMDKQQLLGDAGYRERDVKPVKLPDEYSMMAEEDAPGKGDGEKTMEYMQAWVDERGEPELNTLPEEQRVEKALVLPPGQSVTVKKRKFGDVTLKALDEKRFGVQLPRAKDFVEFDSLSAACDHVWVVSKGYNDADAYKQEKGVTKIPSGAGWRFWGIKPTKELTLE